MIGFVTPTFENRSETERTPRTTAPRKSLAEVYFEDCHRHLTYYNDRFDLRVGDFVYVDGKLAGMRGRVTEVNYTFKIKVSDYKRVIALVNTDVSGQFYIAGSHFVTFDRGALPREQASLWFKAPAAEDEEYVSSSDENALLLEDPKTWDINAVIAERGQEYYLQNRVRYLCLDGTHGYAIVQGSEPYEVEFAYQSGEIRALVCSCFCSYRCKHEVAVLLQLRETLERIEKHYGKEYAQSGYIAAVPKSTLFSFVIADKETGSVML